MKVKELVERLESYNQDAEVVVITKINDLLNVPHHIEDVVETTPLFTSEGVVEITFQD